MIEQIKGLRNDVQMSRGQGGHLQESKVQVDVWACRKRVPCMRCRACRERVDVSSVASWAAVGAPTAAVIAGGPGEVEQTGSSTSLPSNGC
jgi:hypothetical protein